MVGWLLWVGCPKATPVAPVAPVASIPTGAPWAAELFTDHPLVGRIWDVRTGTFASEEQLVADLSDADFVMLGEKHDNPDHHRLQAALVAAVHPKACVFEMLDHADPVAGVTDPDALAAAVDWEHSGWPEFAIYRPVFAACYDAGATVVAGHPTRAEVKTAMMEGMSALAPEVTKGLPDHPLDDAQRASLSDEIVESHCGHAPPDLVDKMIVGQVFKDAFMARTLTDAGPPAVLVAGGGHARSDRGVPIYLGDRTVRSVLWVEVHPDRTAPADYPDEKADWLWFTPTLSDEDPCVVFAKQLQHMSHPPVPAPAPADAPAADPPK
jgi:uncharacterized iron-regulated protein